MLDPQRAVLVEGGDALRRRHELRAGLVGGRADEFTMACLAGPSFHEGNGFWALAVWTASTTNSAAAVVR